MLRNIYTPDGGEVMFAIGIFRNMIMQRYKPNGDRDGGPRDLGGRFYKIEDLSVSQDGTIVTVIGWGDDGGVQPPTGPEPAHRWVPHRCRVDLRTGTFTAFKRCLPDNQAYVLPTLMPGIVDTI